MVFNDKLVHISIKDEVEERLLDREQILLETIAEQESKKGPIKSDLGLTMYETRKINEQNLREMKDKMQDHIYKRTQEQRSLKVECLNEYKKEVEAKLEENKIECQRNREIKKIIKNEQKAELDRNIQVFLHLNKEEKGLRQELVDKQLELKKKENKLRIRNVQHHHKVHSIKKEE